MFTKVQHLMEALVMSVSWMDALPSGYELGLCIQTDLGVNSTATFRQTTLSKCPSLLFSPSCPSYEMKRTGVTSITRLLKDPMREYKQNT